MTNKIPLGDSGWYLGHSKESISGYALFDEQGFPRCLFEDTGTYLKIAAALRPMDGGSVREILMLLLKAAEFVTPGKTETAEIKEHDYYPCPLCEGAGELDGEQYINFDGAPLNVLFTGIGSEHVNWQNLFNAFVKAIPKLRAALAQAPVAPGDDVGEVK